MNAAVAGRVSSGLGPTDLSLELSGALTVRPWTEHVFGYSVEGEGEQLGTLAPSMPVPQVSDSLGTRTPAAPSLTGGLRRGGAPSLTAEVKGGTSGGSGLGKEGARCPRRLGPGGWTGTGEETLEAAEGREAAGRKASGSAPGQGGTGGSFPRRGPAE